MTVTVPGELSDTKCRDPNKEKEQTKYFTLTGLGVRSVTIEHTSQFSRQKIPFVYSEKRRRSD